MDDAWQPLIFFAGEDENALKQAFIDLCAKHKGKFSDLEVAQYIFRDLKEPTLRAIQAATYWGKDLAVVEAIRRKIIYGDTENAKEQRLALLKTIAEDTRENAKDRIAAVRLIAEMEGEIVKAIDKKVSYPGGQKPLAAGFLFKIDTDADKRPEEVDEDADAAE